MIPIDEQGRAAAWLERAWLARYLDRELSEEETARFEAYVLDKPELLAEIDADSDLRDTLAAAGARLHSPPEDSAAPAGEAVSPPPAAMGAVAASPEAVVIPLRQTSPARPAPWLALAASLLLGLGLGALLRGLPGDAAGGVRASPARLVFDTMRGVAQQPRWEAGAPEASDVIVDIAVAPDAKAVSLQLSDGPLLVLTASAEGFATFVAPRQLLAGKTATLKVTTGDGRELQRELDFGPARP